MDISRLHFFSYGIVAVNKKLSSKNIEVAPIEKFPFLNGELTDNVFNYGAKGTTDGGVPYELNLMTTGTIEAAWMPLGSSNRVTPPDVRRGELVIIMRFGDTDRYFWVTQDADIRLRKLETVIYAFSGTADENAPQDADNYYFLEISTHKKLIHLHTTQANGEPFAYDIQLNTDRGFFTIQDNEGNSIQMDSANRRIQLFNADNSVFDLDRETLTIHTNVRVEVNTTTAVVNASSFAHVNSPKIDLGENSDLEPSVLGNQLAKWITTELKPWLDNHQHIGNLGKPTSAAMTAPFGPFVPGEGEEGGGVYSKKNRNQ